VNQSAGGATKHQGRDRTGKKTPSWTHISATARHPFVNDQIDAMNRAFKQACARLELTGRNTMPVAELVAVRILELARDGEFDPDKMTEAAVSTLEG
jgi:hypothetical protein